MRYLDKINTTLKKLMKVKLHPSEDILDPYGGAL